MRAIRIHQNGGPEVLTLEETQAPAPGPGEALVRVEATGVNFIDVYQRTGAYKGALPFTPGVEAAGVVEALGEGVQALQRGDRVAYAVAQPGSYAEFAAVAAERLVPVPAGVSSRQAAAAMLQGMTAHYLSHDTYPIKASDTVLVHAAAGGTGLLLVQMARHLGARVLGTVSTPEKAELAREAGADELILYTEADFEAEVKRLTNGRGVDAVYDSVGKTTFDRSLACLRPRGVLALFGQSSGPVPPVDPAVLNAGGSLFLTRPSLFHHIAGREELLSRAAAVLGMVERSELRLRVGQEWALVDAAEAHRRLEGRATTGKLLLVP